MIGPDLHFSLKQSHKKSLQEINGEQRQKELKNNAFKEARNLAANNPEAVKEIERTGFITESFNKYITDSIDFSSYLTRLFGYYDNYLIQIASDSPISYDEKNTIVNAFLLLVITEKRQEFLEENFNKAIAIGGYASLSHKIDFLNYHDNSLFINLI